MIVSVDYSGLDYSIADWQCRVVLRCLMPVIVVGIKILYR
jgi:hypothetical protein